MGQTTNSERDAEIVKSGDQIVTPKKLITDKFAEMAKQYLGSILEAQEKEKNQKISGGGLFKGSTSVVESSVRSPQHSRDKSSGSDVKMSSSNMQDKSSFMESKKSDNTESEDESRIKAESREDRKHKKNRALTESDLESNVFINLGETDTQTLLYIPSC